MADAKQYKDQIDALGKVLTALADLEPDGQQFVMRAASDRLNLTATVGTGLPRNGALGGAQAGSHTLGAGGARPVCDAKAVHGSEATANRR